MKPCRKGYRYTVLGRYGYGSHDEYGSTCLCCSDALPVCLPVCVSVALCLFVICVIDSDNGTLVANLRQLTPTYANLRQLTPPYANGELVYKAEKAEGRGNPLLRPGVPAFPLKLEGFLPRLAHGLGVGAVEES